MSGRQKIHLRIHCIHDVCRRQNVVLSTFHALDAPLSRSREIQNLKKKMRGSSFHKKKTELKIYLCSGVGSWVLPIWPGKTKVWNWISFCRCTTNPRPPPFRGEFQSDQQGAPNFVAILLGAEECARTCYTCFLLFFSAGALYPWSPRDLPRAKAIMQYNLAVAHAIRGEGEKALMHLSNVSCYARWKTHEIAIDSFQRLVGKKLFLRVRSSFRILQTAVQISNQGCLELASKEIPTHNSYVYRSLGREAGRYETDSNWLMIPNLAWMLQPATVTKASILKTRIARPLATKPASTRCVFCCQMTDQKWPLCVGTHPTSNLGTILDLSETEI